MSRYAVAQKEEPSIVCVLMGLMEYCVIAEEDFDEALYWARYLLRRTD